VSQTDTLITQIAQVIQEIRDIKGDEIPSSNKYHKNSQLLDTTNPTAQKEHNTHPKLDTDGKGESDGVRTSDNK
jgi:hypothetical protein